MSDFHKFALAVHTRFNQLAKGELFQAGDGHALYAHYLASFPEGTNPIYKTNTEHDCNCCKAFIRNIGNAVSIKEGKIHTVWGHLAGLDSTYSAVATAMDAYVRLQPIEGLWRKTEAAYGAETTRALLEDGTAKQWKHFHGSITGTKFLAPANADAQRGAYKTSLTVFKRGLEELNTPSLKTVAGLISSNSIYRGAEHKSAVDAFIAAQQVYNQLAATKDGKRAQELWLWENANTGLTHFRNSSIGTLVQNLSEGKDLEEAVRMFEAMVAPANYKRTTALISPEMVKRAVKTLEDMGLTSALERRFAKISDVTVNNVLWVDNTDKALMRGSLENILLAAAVKPRGSPKAGTEINIDIDSFMANVVPEAVSMELLFTNHHKGNLVSLTTAKDETAARLFKWKNPFAWSYNGNVTDSIKERVKAAGGKTNAPLRVSLAWFNKDDLDIHANCPDGHVFFANKMSIQDVDMNAGTGRSTTPVENMSWLRPKDGYYEIVVNNYFQRDTSNGGFVLEVENNGVITQYSHAKHLKNKDTINALRFNVVGGVIKDLEVDKSLVGGSISEEVWGIETEKFVKVRTLMHSPNFWDDQQVGNKHHIFVLDRCNNPEPARGIYNEYLRKELDEHRKVFEVLGDKTKCEASTEQLSGLGFSSTKEDVVTIRVEGVKQTRTYNVHF